MLYKGVADSKYIILDTWSIWENLQGKNIC